MIFAFMSASYVYPPKPEVQFVADHPFFLSIASRNNDVLFVGRLSKL
jgi:serine protease inhibitor